MWCVGNKREMTFAIYLLTDFLVPNLSYFCTFDYILEFVLLLSKSWLRSPRHSVFMIVSVYDLYLITFFPFVARVLCSCLPQWLARGHNILLSMMIGFKNVLKKISSNKSSENRINQKGKVFWMEWRKKCRSVRFAWFGLLVRSTPMLVRDK